jgi:Na+/H+ antiporter NhaC
MGRIFPASTVLTLAWASGATMRAVGADRLFSRWILDEIDPETLLTLSFVISFFMALATGTSWGNMSILFPLILVPTYKATYGDELIFYAVTAEVLSGSVAGDPFSPISDTTVLSALASDCTLLAHVVTQAPYAIVCVIISILFGTLPIGRDAWPNIVGIRLGAAAVVGFVYFVCVPVQSPTGRHDIFTELYLKVQACRQKDSNLIEPCVDAIKFVSGNLTPLDKTVTVDEQVMEKAKNS